MNHFVKITSQYLYLVFSTAEHWLDGRWAEQGLRQFCADPPSDPDERRMWENISIPLVESPSHR